MLIENLCKRLFRKGIVMEWRGYKAKSKNRRVIVERNAEGSVFILVRVFNKDTQCMRNRDKIIQQTMCLKSDTADEVLCLLMKVGVYAQPDII